MTYLLRYTLLKINDFIKKLPYHSFRYIAILFFLGYTSSCNSPDSESKLHVTPNIGDVLDKTAHNDSLNLQPQRKLHYLDSFYATQHYISVIDKWEYYYFCFYTYMNNLKDDKKAMLYTDSMLLLIQSQKRSTHLNDYLSMSYYSKGDVLYHQGLFNDALDYFYLANKCVTGKYDSLLSSYYNYRIAMVMYKQQKYDESNVYFKRCYGDMYSCNDMQFSVFYRKQEVINSVALTYYKINELDSALIYYNKTLDYIDKYTKKHPYVGMGDYEKAKGVVFGNIGSVYEAMKNFNLAKEYYIKSIDINSLPGREMTDAQFTSIKLAKLFFQERDFTNMFEVLKKVRVVLDSMPNIEVEIEWNKIIYEYYSSNHEPDKAFTYSQKYIQLKDSLSKRANSLNEMDVNGVVANLDNRLEISTLKKTNDTKQFYLIVAVVMSILLIIIVILIVSILRRTRKHIIALSQLNQQVNEQKIQLELALVALEGLNKEKDRILRAVAHDLMNPIAAISSLSDLVLFSSDGLNDEQKEYLEMIKSVCTNAISLSKEILEAATAIDPDTMEKSEVNVQQLITESIDLLQFKASDKGQKIVTEMPTAPVMLPLNKEKMWRAISNIINNAIKFSPEGVTIVVGMQNLDKEVVITIKDNGIGIPSSMKDKVFETFTEARRLGTAGEKPFGLGLSITRQVVGAHGGKVWFESEPNKGTTFFISLPKTRMV